MAGSGPSLDRIDEALAGAQAAVAKLGPALFELDAERERRRPDLPHLTGTSEAAWNASATQLSVLWSWYRTLASAIEGITDRRQATARRPADLLEIWELLSTASIEVPLDSRELARSCLPESEMMPERASIALLVRVISETYEHVAETIASLFAVRDMALPRLEELARAMSQADDQAMSTGLRLPNAAVAIRRQLDELRDQTSSDPLSVDVDQIPSLAAAVERVGADVAEAAALLANVEEEFADLETSLQSAEAGIRDAGAAVGLANEKIAGVGVGPDDVVVLEQAADHLRDDLSQARLRAATDRPGAQRAARALEARIATVRSDAARLTSAATEPIAVRQELRGRLDGYRAKAYSLGRGEDTYLDRLYRAAQDLLYTAPCDLAGAERRIAAYQAAVSASGEDRLS